MDIEKIADKIRKLLALSTSSNEAEASLAYSKAHELLRQYNIEMSDVEAKEQSELEQLVVLKGKQYKWEIDLADCVARDNYCSCIFGGRMKKTTIFIGRKYNTICAKEMFYYLYLAIEKISKGKGLSFRIGMVMGLSSRMLEAKRLQEVSNALVVVSSESQKLADELTMGRKINSKYNVNMEEYMQGIESQKSISLNKQIGV